MKNKEMEEKLQKVREKLVNEKCEKRDKASSLIEVLRKSKLITKEETEEIRKKIIDNFNKKEDTGVYEEVNKKFHGIRKIRREMAKINKEMEGEENKLEELDEKIGEIKEVDVSNLSNEERKNMKEEYDTLLKQKKDIQGKMNELNERKQEKEEEEKEMKGMLGIKIKDGDKGINEEIKEEKGGRKIGVTPIETEEVSIIDVPMKEIGKKRWDFFGGERGIENTDEEKVTPKMYYKQKEGELKTLEEDYEWIEEKLEEDIYLDEGYKTNLLNKLREKYNKAREEIEEDEVYKEIKEKQETLKKKLEEMEKKKTENQKEIAEINQEIRKIKEGNISDDDKSREFDLVDKKARLSAEYENLVEEIDRCKEEYGEFDDEGTQNIENNFISVIGGRKLGISKMKIGGKILEVKNVEKSLKDKNGKDIIVAGKQVKWGGDILGEFKGICEETRPYPNDKIHLFCEVGGKPLFWAYDKTNGGDKYINYKLMWGNDECGVVKGLAYEQRKIGEKPCIKIEKKSGKEIVIWGDKQIGGVYSHISEIKEVGGKPYFLATKKNGKEVVIWGDKQIGPDYYHIKHFFGAGGKPCVVAQKEKDGGYEIIWLDKKLLGHYNVRSVREAGGKPVFRVEDRGERNKIIWWDKQIGSDYYSVFSIKEVCGKPCFEAEICFGYDVVVIWGDKQIGGVYSHISEIKEVCGKPYFCARNRNGKAVTIRGGKQIGKESDHVTNLVGVIGGKPTFLIQNNEEKRVVIRGSEQIGEEYEGLSGGVDDKRGKPYFVATKKSGAKVAVWGKTEVLETKGDFSKIDSESGEGKLCFEVSEHGNKYKVIVWDNGTVIKEKI